MKVLIIGSRVPWPLRDGGAIATYNLLKGLSESGVEVSFLTLNTIKHFAEDNEIFKQLDFLEVIGYRNIDTSVKLLPALLNLFTGRSYNIDRFINPGFREDILEELNDKKYDLIHFEGLFVAAYAEHLKTNIPKILRQHNIEFHIWQSLATTEKNILKKWYLKLLARRLEKFEKRIVHCFDAVVCITEADKKNIDEMGFKGHSLSIPAGIEPVIVKDVPINYNTIYHIGSMEWYPNQEAMAWFHSGIWPLIQQKNKNAVFYMAGKNMPKAYRKWADKSFKVLGEVNSVVEFSADKSILVVPLKSGSGIRIKTIEAMLAGKAVVSTSFGAKGIPLIHGTHCLIADKEAEFTEAVIRLLEDNELRNRIATQGKKLAEELYGNRAVSAKWVEFYKTLSHT